MICDVDYMCKSPRDRVTRTKVGNPSSSYHKPDSWHIGGSSQQAASKAEGTLGEELNDSSRTRMGQLTGAASVLLCACFIGGHFPWSHTGSSYFLLEVLVFLLSLWFTSRSHHLYHTPRGREEESSGAGQGQICIQGAFLSFSHSFHLHIALERLGIKMALVNRTVRK